MKKSLALILASVLMLTGLAFADDPVIVVIDNKLVKADQIVSPTISFTGTKAAISPGDIVVIGANISNQYPTYVKTQTYEWTVTENGYVKRTWAQGNQVMFGAGIVATKFQINLKANFSYVVGTQEVVISKEESVEVVVGTPTPVPPTPTPVPPTPVPPTPTPTPSLTGAAKFAYVTAMAIGPVTKASSAPILAESFATIAADIGKDLTLNDPKTLLLHTKESNNAELLKKGFKGVLWDAWGDALQDYLWDMVQAKTLVTPDDYKKIWGDIAQGLALVK
jgi:hypothetical protein